jgi:hypothetical protein
MESCCQNNCFRDRYVAKRFSQSTAQNFFSVVVWTEACSFLLTSTRKMLAGMFRPGGLLLEEKADLAKFRVERTQRN